MQRRDFLTGTLVAGATALASGAPRTSHRFSPCLNEATTLDAPFEKDCEAYSAAGFRHIELWFAKLRKQGLKAPQVESLMRQHGLTPASACASEAALWRQQGSLESHLPGLERNFEMAQALNVPRYVLFSSVSGEVTQDDYRAAVERFARVAELAAGYEVRIAFEFIALSSLYGSLLSSLQLLREAAQPNAGVCLDTFHFFAGVSKFEDLQELRPGEVEHVHFHDVPASIPREILVDPNRVPPGHGVIPLKQITAALRRIGYQGALSTELFGARYQKGDPFSVAKLCYKALALYCAA
ncbi:MAG TPA: sugar phosphate isomerase/epimerase [Terriglobia bacterium]|nr:sugar phosphate isomerase/epimerase [Terriglobia bacterium]